MKKFTVILFAVLAALAACGKASLEGKYVGPMGFPSLEFKSNGKAIYMDAVEMDYELDGKEIKLKTPKQGTLILKILDDGSISYPLLGKFTKVEK